MNAKIPIIVLTRNEPEFLERTIRSLKHNTRYPHQIIICDNASDRKHQLDVLDEFQESGVKVFRNTSNNWVLGLNPALRWITHNRDSFDPDFCVITDGDIEFPNLSDLDCWLTQLLETMQENKFLGKLGLSLSIQEISEHLEFKPLLDSERGYRSEFLCPGVYLAPVDTTTAIYRYDCMVTKNLRFYPGHNSYIRPDLYVGRAQHLSARHLGWEKYGQRHEYNSNTTSKIICFSIFGAYVDPLELAKAPVWLKLFRKLVHPTMKLLWSLRLLFCWVIYIWGSRIIYQNRQYYRSRFVMRSH